MTNSIETVTDTNGKEIKLHDVLKDEESGEMAIVVYAENKAGVKGLAVENQIVGINDWLDVYPDEIWTIVGNMAVCEEVEE